MFTWICPKCGAEVPPAYNECPRCSPPSEQPPRQAAAPVAPPPRFEAPPVIPAQAASIPTAAPLPVQPLDPVREAFAASAARRASETAAAPRYVPEKQNQLPAWLVSVLTIAGMAAILGIVYYFVSGRSPRNDAARNTVTAPVQAAAPVEPKSGVGTSDATKNLEFTGIRVKEDKKQKLEVQFLAVNHSLAELPAMKLDVRLKTIGKSDILAEFPAELPSLGPFETREITTTAKSKLRAYELPDWQFLQAEVDATEPKD